MKLYHPNAKVPQRVLESSIGYDLFTPVDFDVPPDSSVLVDTGVALDFGTYGHCSNYAVYGKIEAKSGLVLHRNVQAFPGVIDPDYRGTLKVCLRNYGSTVQSFKQGQAVAQLVFQMAQQPDLNADRMHRSPRDPPTGTSRGTRGFGEMDREVYGDESASPRQEPGSSAWAI